MIKSDYSIDRPVVDDFLYFKAMLFIFEASQLLRHLDGRIPVTDFNVFHAFVPNSAGGEALLLVFMHRFHDTIRGEDNRAWKMLKFSLLLPPSISKIGNKVFGFSKLWIHESR